jgi:hypothetical protein
MVENQQRLAEEPGRVVRHVLHALWNELARGGINSENASEIARFVIESIPRELSLDWLY